MRNRFGGPRLALAAVLAAALAAPGFAQDITDVTPTEVSIGTEITITGNGFGTKKPKVVTIADAPAKEAKDKWKVTDFSDTRIVAILRKVNKNLGPGARTLRVTPKKADDITETTALTVMSPEITMIDPNTDVAPKDEITIKGNFFGTKKGKVFIGDIPVAKPFKKAKVISWTPNEIVARVNKKQPEGMHDVQVVNKVGPDVEPDSITTMPPAGGGGGGGGGGTGRCPRGTTAFGPTEGAAGNDGGTAITFEAFMVQDIAPRGGATRSLVISFYDCERRAELVVDVTVDDPSVGQTIFGQLAPGARGVITRNNDAFGINAQGFVNFTQVDADNGIFVGNVDATSVNGDDIDFDFNIGN